MPKADVPILKDEPLCYNSRDYLRQQGDWDDDEYEMQQAYEGRGPNKDCACDVCFYGRRAHWLDGRASLQVKADALDWIVRFMWPERQSTTPEHHEWEPGDGPYEWSSDTLQEISDHLHALELVDAG